MTGLKLPNHARNHRVGGSDPIDFPSSGGDLVKLHHEKLAAQGDFSFSSISQAYSHLWCIVMGRIDDADGSSRLRFNGDTSHYTSMLEQAQSAFVFGGDFTTSGIEIDYFAASGYPAGQVGTHAFLIPAYSGTDFHKQVIDAGGFPGGSPLEYDAVIGEWAVTDAITSIDLIANAPGFAVGSTFDVYALT